MNVRFFEEAINDEDLPLVKDYLRLSPDLDELHVVKKFMVIPKGLMTFCDRFKGTVWNNKSIYQELLDAVIASCELAEFAPTFVVKACANGQVAVGVDDDLLGTGVWLKTSDKTYEFKQKKQATTNSQPVNRFLAASQKSLLLASSHASAGAQEEPPSTDITPATSSRKK